MRSCVNCDLKIMSVAPCSTKDSRCDTDLGIVSTNLRPGSVRVDVSSCKLLNHVQVFGGAFGHECSDVLCDRSVWRVSKPLDRRLILLGLRIAMHHWCQEATK